MKFSQQSFRGGLNQYVDPTKTNKDEYSFLKNGRVRFDTVDWIAKPVLSEAGLPAGLKQGIYQGNNYLLAFVAGAAYYRDVSVVGSVFQQVVGFAMSPDAPVIFAQPVSSSSLNFARAAVATGSNSEILITDPTTGSGACIVCQDGLNQPQLILPTGATRPAFTYAQWTLDNREYVPIGKQMCFAGGILYIASADGSQVLRSVTGRPLDFMVVVDTNGNKLPDPVDGDAFAVSHRVSYNTITGLFPTNSADGSITVGTTNSTHLVTPRLDSLIFGEPLFRNTDLFSTGPLNNNCFADILGDTAIVDLEGIKSFNAVLQLKNTGKSNPLSAQISRALEGIKQPQYVCTGDFDLYILFAIKTVYGDVVVVYDKQLQKFVSFDFWSITGSIKQFAAIQLPGLRKLFFITTNNQLYEAYASNENESVAIFCGEWISGTSMVEQQPAFVKAILFEPIEIGTLYASVYGDRIAGERQARDVRNPVAPQVNPITPPFGVSVVDAVRNIVFNVKQSTPICYKAGIYLEWNFKTKLALVELDSEDVTKVVSYEETAQEAEAISAGVPEITSFVPDSGPVATLIQVIGTNFLGVTNVTIDDADCVYQIITDSVIQVTVPVGCTSGIIKLYKTNSTAESTSSFTVL